MSAITFSPIATRFAWKEYRTLRGFWLAALVIAALVQSTALVIHSGVSHSRLAELFFGVALAAAALYAVGVAATTFSMEHEDETYQYLSGLPTRWLPLFAGKLSFAFASSLALALALAICGWLLSSWNFPGRDAALAKLGVFGFAIIELLAWGMFFSLLLRQPLLAALLAIGAESLALTVAVNTFVEGNLPALALSSYFQVLPARIAIAACVFAVDVLLARRWLTQNAPSSAAKSAFLSASARASTANHSAIQHAISPIAGAGGLAAPRVFAHLAWQAWRQSWRLLLAAIALAGVLACIPPLVLHGAPFRFKEESLALAPFALGLIAAALYASLVFASDHRGRSYRFLAEHSAWPRLVWLSRLAMWLIPVAIVLSVAARFKILGARALAVELYQISSGSSYWRQHGQPISYFAAALESAFWGILLGLGLGQACSLFFRRPIVAGFAAFVISLPLLVWGLAIWSWELSAATFVLPLVVGLFAATWLRIPDWIVDRNSLRGWLKVAAALIIPLAFIGWRLPTARELPVENDRMALAQIAGAVGIKPSLNSDAGSFDVSTVLANWIARFETASTDAESAAGDRLVRLSETIEKPSVNTKNYNRRLVELNRPIAEEARDFCAKAFVLPPIYVLDSALDFKYSRLTTLVELLSQAGVDATQEGKLEDALKFHIAALQLWNHVCDATSAAYTLSTSVRLDLQWRLVDWAGAKGQTSERIRRALAELDDVYPPSGIVPADGPFRIDETFLGKWTPPASLMIEYLDLRDILLGKQPSNLLTRNAGAAEYLAVMANQIPFERNRALKLLDYLMVIQTAQWYSAVSHANQAYLQQVAQERVNEGGAANAVDTARLIRGQIQLASELSFDPYPNIVRERDYPPYSWLRTSPLLRKEFERERSFGLWLGSVVDREVAAWGLRQQLALVAYKLDLGEYPESLDALVPDYLPFVPIDAYSGLPFEYRPHGLPLKLYEVAAGTPVLWSVGPADAKLQVRLRYDAVDPDNAVSAQDSTRRDVYTLEGTELQYRGGLLVFPLPKTGEKAGK